MRFLKYTWKFVIAAFFVLSLTLNIAFLVGGSIYQMASSAFGAMSGLRTVALQHADEVAQLGDNLAKERATSRKLKNELSDATNDLATERLATRKLKGELVETTGNLTAERLVTCHIP